MIQKFQTDNVSIILMQLVASTLVQSQIWGQRLHQTAGKIILFLNILVFFERKKFFFFI